MPEEAPLVELARSLADEMDAGGGSRVYTAYLSVLKDIRRVLNASPSRDWGKADAAQSAPAVEEADDAPLAPVSKLEMFHQKHGIA